MLLLLLLFFPCTWGRDSTGVLVLLGCGGCGCSLGDGVVNRWVWSRQGPASTISVLGASAAASLQVSPPPLPPPTPTRDGRCGLLGGLGPLAVRLSPDRLSRPPRMSI